MHLEWRLRAGTVLRNGKVAVAACVIALLSAGIARAAIVFGPGDQQSPAGQTVEWTFSVSDDSATALLQSGSFTIPDVTETGPFQPVLKGTTNNVDCTMAARLAGGFTAQTKWLGSPFDRVAVTWAYIPDGTPVTITSGELMTCKFTINSEASGDIDLGCTNQDASDPDGNTLEGVTCQAGTLAIGEAPTPTPTSTPTATPTETPSGPGPFVGCYTGTFPVSQLGGQLATINLVCNDNKSMTGSTIILPSGLGSLTCTGACCAECADFDAQCTGLATVDLSGMLPAESGPITLSSGGTTGDVTIDNVPCPGQVTATPTKTKTPTKTPGTPGGGGGALISESGCQMTASNTTGTPWALIIPAAALLVLRRRRG